MLLKTIQPLLKKVQKPSQYLGNEVNSVHKDFNSCDVRIVLVFPDAYEMGMSHMGLKILYEILNNIEGVVAERCFAPLPDMEQELRTHNVPLFSLESKIPLKDFDIIGICLPYELTYTNVLNILDLAQIPLWQKDRSDHHPLILGGGTQSYNPEPVADFFDAIAIGDGEELVVDVVSVVRDSKTKKDSKPKLLNRLTEVEGLYIPSFFEPTYNPDGTLKHIKALKEGYTAVKKRIVQNLSDQAYPTKVVVPNIKLIHDRIGIEIQRGCTRMCRFCQAGYIERPTRQRDPQKVLEIAEESIKNTGLDEISLLSLSAGDYQTIVPTLKELNARYRDQNVAISVPATRTETLTPEMIEQVKKVRMTGFTIAPEAGSERMRRVINKGNKVEDLLKACDNAFSAGYKLIKFYYMCGLPFETDDDVSNIATETQKAHDVGLQYTKNININVSVSSFVPKPFTPFQWEPQMTIEETKRKHNLVKHNLGRKALKFKHHDAEMSYLEGLFSRGDRRLSQVVYQAFTNGCRFDEWSEHFDFAKWQQSFTDTGVDLDFYLHRRRDKDEVLPWDHLFSQMKKEWLYKEYLAAAKEAYIADCSVDKCASFCGVCDFKTIKNRSYVVSDQALAVKKGNREWYGRFGSSQNQKTKTLDTKAPKPVVHTRIRAQFSKLKESALMGHLELMTAIKRALVRNQVPVAYSEGFHPQIRLSMGYALPLGIESLCEHFDLIVTEPIDLKNFQEQMNQALPLGLHIDTVQVIDLKAPSIYEQTAVVDYSVTFPQTYSHEALQTLRHHLQEFKQGRHFVTYRKSRKPKHRHKPPKEIIINRYVPDVQFDLDKRTLNFSVKVEAEGSLKPSEVITALCANDQNQMAHLGIQKTHVVLKSSPAVS